MDLAKRKNMRLQNYDYSQNGAYFITVCAKDRREMLWKPDVGANSVRPQNSFNNRYALSEYGLIVNKSIIDIPKHYQSALIDKYVIMPNHIHLIIVLQYDENGRTMFAPTISRIIKHLKENITKQIGISLWQKSFYDHIIRNEQEYQTIWQYIDENPLKWQEDEYYNEISF